LSHSMYRRRRWRTFATAAALTLGSLAIPAAALADGQIDPIFNGNGYHLGNAAEGTVFTNSDNRIPMVVQADGRIVAGGSRGGMMTLVRYNTNGSIDTTFGVGGFATASFGGTPSQTSGNSGATAMTLDATGNIIVAGYGGSQSMVAARFTPGGTLSNYTVCFAPHLIDYSARAVAVRQNGSIVMVGYARDRHPAFAVPAGPIVMYGQRVAVTIPAGATPATPPGNCGAYTEVGGLSRGSANVQIDGLAKDGTVTDATLGGRWYDGVAALPDNRYVVASTNGPDANVAAGNAAWVERFTAAGVLDTGTFNVAGAGSIVPVPGRVVIPNANLHAIRLSGTDAYAAGESLDASAQNRRMLVARIDTNGALVGGFGAGGVALARVGGGNDSGQALVMQGPNVIVGGSANLAGRAAFGLARLNATTGAVDATFGNAGQTATPIGSPAVNAYITGMGTFGNYVVVSGRAADPNGLDVIAARYLHTGAAPPPPAPVAATNTVDQITTGSARVNGTVNANGYASTWWVEYGTTTAYGSTTAVQAIGGTNDDVDVQAALTGLATGTVYHARVVIMSAAGTDPGDDLTFTTLGPPAPPAAGGGTGGTPTTVTPITTGGTKPTTTVTKTAKKKLQCIVPKVTGKKLNSGRRAILARGCKVQLKYVASKKAKGTILSQSRKAGKKLSYRAVVRLIIAEKASAIKSS
jgi:uncharacterized delta-60 repeat protein